MSQYQTQLERVAARFAAIPGRFSEANVTRLGSLNHFEAFQDQVDGRRRLSLSGSIVVLDIDLDNGSPHSVSISLASSDSTDTPVYLQPAHDPNGCILKSLNLPRLDQFTQILEYLSRCDRYSTKDVDCFQALDQVAKAVTTKAQSDPALGTVVINPGSMGVALKYHRSQLAFLDVMAGNDRKFALTHATWLDDTTGEWLTPEPSTRDVRAQLSLRLDPPVALPASLAREWQAGWKPVDSILNKRRVRSSFDIRRHPKFTTVESSDTFDSSVVNLLPYEFVNVSTIPLEHPRQIGSILNRLRQYSYLCELVTSLNRGDPIFHPNDMDISIADVLEFKDKPLPTGLVPIDVVCSTRQSQDLEIDLSIPDAKKTLKINLPAQSNEFTVDINGAINLKDLHQLVQAGNLALAASYIVGYIGVKHHRGSVSLT